MILVQVGLDFRMPVLYITQLMGLAFGLPRRELALGKNMVSPQPVLQKIG